MALKSAPPYLEGHNLLVGKSVMITAAAGAGIGLLQPSALQKKVPEVLLLVIFMKVV